MASETTVIHVRDMQPGDVYIGRKSSGRQQSKLGNPYRVASRHISARLDAIAQFENYITTYRADLMEAIPELKGKRLACWCAPKPCHGDVLARLANGN